MEKTEFQLRVYCYLDRMQPQFAAFVGTITQGDLPVEGMASLYVEMAPGNEVFRTVDIAVRPPKPSQARRSSSVNSACSRCTPTTRLPCSNPGVLSWTGWDWIRKTALSPRFFPPT